MVQNRVKTLRFFSPQRKLLGEVDDAVIIFISKWSTYGNFTIKLPEMKSYIAVDNRVMFDKDERKTGVIKYVYTGDDGTVTIKGFSLLWFLSYRITVPDSGSAYVSYNAPIEDIMIDLVRKNAVECQDSKRALPGLEVAVSQGRGEKIAFQTRYEELTEVLSELSKASMLGICIRMDLAGGRDVFEVLEGTDRSISQSSTPPVIFRRKYDNLLYAEYTMNDSNTKNCAYTAGQGEGEEREVYIVGDEKSGYGRKELYVDARDIENPEELPDRGKSKLAGMQPQENFEATISDDWYKSRWDIGDIVTIIDDNTGIGISTRISETEESQDESGYCVIPTFGIPEKTAQGRGG